MKKLAIPFLALGFLAVAPVQADDTPLGEQMEIISDSYKGIRRAKEASEGAKLCQEAQQAVLKAFNMTPQFVEAGKHPEGADKAMVEYRKQMAELLVLFVKAEAVFAGGDMTQLDPLVDAFKESKSLGHEQFIEE